MNVRDTASINELVILSNMESLNAEMLKQGAEKATRFRALQQLASEQLQHLNAIVSEKRFKAIAHTEQNLLK